MGSNRQKIKSLIPRSLPSRTEVMAVPFGGDYSTVVITENLVLLNSGDYDRGVEPRHVYALVGLERADLHPTFRVSLNVGISSGSVSAPCQLANGDIALSAYEEGLGVTLLILNGRGEILWRCVGSANAATPDWDDVPSAIQMVSTPLPVPGNTPRLIVSWDSPERRMECRSASEGVLWGASEWALGMWADVIVGESRDRIVARNAASGEKLWETYASDRYPLAVEAGMVFALDSPLDGPGTHSLGVGELRAFDVQTGRDRLQVDTQGELVSFLVTAHMVGFVSVAGDGIPVIYLLDLQTNEVRSSRACNRDSLRKFSHGRNHPRLVAIDHTCLLWANEDFLVCEPLAELGAEMWRMRLPAPCHGTQPHPSSFVNIFPPNIVSDGKRIFMRDGSSLWVATET